MCCFKRQFLCSIFILFIPEVFFRLYSFRYFIIFLLRIIFKNTVYMSYLLWEYGLLVCFLLLWGRSFKNNFTMILFIYFSCMWTCGGSKGDLQEVVFSIYHVGSKDWSQQDGLMSHLPCPGGYFPACFLCVRLGFNPFVLLTFIHEVNFHELEVDSSNFIDWAPLPLFGSELEHTAANLWRCPGSVPFPTSCRLCSAFLHSLFLRVSLISENLTLQGHPSSEESMAQLLSLPNPKVMVPRTFPLYFLRETLLESPLAIGDRSPGTQWSFICK